MMSSMHTPPTSIKGTAVVRGGEVVTIRGQQWVTLVPEADEDTRLWEFSLSTGRLLLMQDGIDDDD